MYRAYDSATGQKLPGDKMGKVEAIRFLMSLETEYEVENVYVASEEDEGDAFSREDLSTAWFEAFDRGDILYLEDENEVSNIGMVIDVDHEHGSAEVTGLKRDVDALLKAHESEGVFNCGLLR